MRRPTLSLSWTDISCIAGMIIGPAGLAFAIEAFVAIAGGEAAAIIFQQPIFLLCPALFGLGGACMSAIICHHDLKLAQRSYDAYIESHPQTPPTVAVEMKALRDASNSRRNSYSSNGSLNKQTEDISPEIVESISNLQTVVVQPPLPPSATLILSGGPSAQLTSAAATSTPQAEVSLLRSDHLQATAH